MMMFQKFHLAKRRILPISLGSLYRSPRPRRLQHRFNLTQKGTTFFLIYSVKAVSTFVESRWLQKSRMSSATKILELSLTFSLSLIKMRHPSLKIALKLVQ